MRKLIPFLTLLSCAHMEPVPGYAIINMDEQKEDMEVCMVYEDTKTLQCITMTNFMAALRANERKPPADMCPDCI